MLKKKVKKLTSTIIFTLAAIFSFGQANVYHPFPDSNAVWHEVFAYVDGSNTWRYDWHYHDISGDTTIGNFTYHKLYKFGDSNDYFSDSHPSSSSSSFYRTFCGAFRQDIANKKIFMYDFIWDHKDTVAYDFNMNVGDTLPFTYLFSGQMWVTSIDSFPVGDHYNKRFWIRELLSGRLFELIEGIGSSSGGFEFLGYYFECDADLICMKLNNETIYPDSTYNCMVVTQTPYLQLENEISISPNPCSQNTIIQVNYPLRDASYEIYDIFGRIVKTEKNISGQKIEFQRGNLPDGLYFVLLHGGNKVYSIQKVIIIQ